jgi:hypothetical protein
VEHAKGNALAYLLANIRLARDKHPCLLRTFVNYGRKNFIALVPGVGVHVGVGIGVHVVIVVVVIVVVVHVDVGDDVKHGVDQVPML